MSNRKTARTTPQLKANFLNYRDSSEFGDFYRTIEIDTDEWRQWIARHQTFSYDGKYTVRCERIKNKNSSFWYAYQKDENGKLKKKYIGVDTAVTNKKLLAIWAAFRYGEDSAIYKSIIS
jgi:hypothetical protein